MQKSHLRVAFFMDVSVPSYIKWILSKAKWWACYRLGFKQVVAAHQIAQDERHDRWYCRY